MKTIDWRQARRWWSVRVSALGSLLFALLTAFPDQALALWANLPAEIRERLPDNLERAIGAALFAVVLVVRVIPQEEADGE
ncbi:MULTISPECIES: hypothetical protein [Sphingomonas]|uniref:Holin n=1 Tax=Sphingomonas molluscorum TaxID=418184 RepID=A0ABU8Q7H8_9SPHN|nr:hypothetical protein [Sphingomonas sp. JUb134]MBM7407045.1 hypothetical protein [Sphingomonas sp. JUb134]